MAFNMHDGGILLLQKVKNSTCKCYCTCIFKELNLSLYNFYLVQH